MSVSIECKRFFHDLLQGDVDRYSPEQALQHSWIKRWTPPAPNTSSIHALPMQDDQPRVTRSRNQLRGARLWPRTRP